MEYTIKISITIFEDIEKWLRNNLDDLVCNVDRTTPVIGELILNNTNIIGILIEDKEEGKTFSCPWSDIAKGFNIFVEWVCNAFRDKANHSEEFRNKRWYGSGWESPFDMTDPCNWDVESTEALLQCIVYGKIIYG